jgi:hypothetical protein
VTVAGRVLDQSWRGLTMVPVAAALVAAGPAAPAGPSRAGAVPDRLAEVLTVDLQFSPSDVQSLARGNIIARSLSAGDSREVPVAGAARFDVPLSYYLARARDIVTFKQGDEVLQIGLFGPRASAADLAGLSLDKQDVDDLKKCELDRCKVKLDAAGLARFRTEMAWNEPGATERAHQLARDVIAGYVLAYQLAGNLALIEYRDQEEPIRVADETRALLDRSPWVLRTPGLREYVEAYPRSPTVHAENILYWSKEAFGLKPVVSVTHTILWRGPDGPADAVLLSKQVYASHYFDGSVSYTLLVEDRRPDQPGVFVVYINRSNIDQLRGGLLGPIRRSIARSRARGGVEDNLDRLRKRLEKDYKAAPAAGSAAG